MSLQSVTAPAVVAAGLGLLAAACGSGSPTSHVAQLGSTTTQISPSRGALAFAACMRSHGVLNWPDPNAAGAFDKTKVTPQQLGVGDSRIEAARGACRHLLPNGGQPPNQAQLQQQRAQALRFSQCIRAHGVPNFPDPVGTGGERIPDPASAGVDQGSPRFEAANDACAKYRPPYVPSNSAYNAWARTQTGSGS